MLTLGRKITIARARAGITSQAKLGVKAGLRRDYINRLERGKLTNPTLDTLTSIATACGLTAGQLLEIS